MSRYFDLSKDLSQESVVWPGQTPVRLTKAMTRVEHGVLCTDYHGSLHNGTHIDAPSHFGGGSLLNVNEIPLDVLCGPGVVLDVSREDWGAVTADDLEEASPAIRSGDRVILNFGWHRLLLDDANFDDERFILRYPGLDNTAVDWLVAKGVTWVGSDTPSPDHAFALKGTLTRARPDVFTDEVRESIDLTRWPPQYCHRTLLAASIPMIEQLGGQLDEVTGKRVMLYALPPRYVAEASQIRVMAEVVADE